MENYFLTSTKDTRDRSSEIEQKLQTLGVCILTPGTYYVSGITMPKGTSLLGMGEPSTIVLLEDVAEGYAVSMQSDCTVKDLTFLGGDAEMPRPTEVGNRHGIGFVSTSTPEDRGDPPADAIISGCRIRCFSGGGITCRDTSYGINCSLSVTNCRIHNCGAGINISRFSEFHNFTNVTSTRNLYGCINNGGNNVFIGCGFDGNTLGFLIDNSEKQSPNCAHGSCVACTFNHTDFNKGVGIRILGAKPGFVFSDCQMFFSNVDIENSKGIQLNHFNIGNAAKLRVAGESTVSVTGCVFGNEPEFALEGDPVLTVQDCWTRKEGTAVAL